MPDINTRHGIPSPLDVAEYERRLDLLRRAKAGDPAAVKTLADRYHVRIGGVGPTETLREEATMTTAMARCDLCGKLMAARGLGVHKARAHKHGNSGQPHPPATIRRDLDTAAITHNSGQAESGTGRDCAACPLAGNHAEQDLFTQLVRGGLSLADAVARMAQARVVYGG